MIVMFEDEGYFHDDRILTLPMGWGDCCRLVSKGTPAESYFETLPRPIVPAFGGCAKHTIYRGTEKYLTRYWLLGGHDPKTNSTKHPDLPFNLFLHCFHASDDPPAHDHPWPWARSLILQGSYVETRVRMITRGMMNARPAIDGVMKKTYRPGDVNDIDSSTRHYVTLQTPEVWTLFLVGQKDRPWGFWTPDGWVRACDFVGPDVVDDER